MPSHHRGVYPYVHVDTMHSVACLTIYAVASSARIHAALGCLKIADFGEDGRRSQVQRNMVTCIAKQRMRRLLQCIDMLQTGGVVYQERCNASG